MRGCERRLTPEQPLESSLDLVLQAAPDCSSGIDRDAGLFQRAAQFGWQHYPVFVAREAREVSAGLG